ncbi:hypothetical protein PHPALM_16870 [Phytophthora palmivora]|uniref:Uncharacterized protein n=1 Tax=Phytophthora palmivora TaxID=4796 RepID=A0A2P4XNN4_9STRA|nr:hypothetical protein PHPALM_16870 [Phytophthora palmivora]
MGWQGYAVSCEEWTPRRRALTLQASQCNPLHSPRAEACCAHEWGFPVGAVAVLAGFFVTENEREDGCYPLIEAVVKAGNLQTLQWMIAQGYIDDDHWLPNSKLASGVSRAFAGACGQSSLAVVWWFADYIIANDITIDKILAEKALSCLPLMDILRWSRGW